MYIIVGILSVCLFIKGDSGAKINILESDTIGHCEKKVRIAMCPTLNGSEIQLFETTNAEKFNVIIKQLINCYSILGWDHAVAQLGEALRYNPEGRGFDSRWCHWNFSLT